MSNTITELEEFKECEAIICALPPSQTDCPSGFCIVVASPYGMAEICIDEKEHECLKHLGVLTEEKNADYNKVSDIVDILKQCLAV
jgi:hypothetical protein